MERYEFASDNTAGVAPEALTAIIEASGADVLCFGGTKAGLGLTEAVIFFDPAMADEFDYRCKQAGQLASKMRFLSAPWAPMLSQGHWLRYARVANGAAQLLAQSLRDLRLEPLYPVEANAVFIKLAPAVAAALLDKGWHFYDFNGASRFMCSWKVDERMVGALIDDFKEALRSQATLQQVS